MIPTASNCPPNKKRRFLGIVILIAIVVPFVINFLILGPALFPTVGTPTDWLAFWGCYLGGMFAAIVGFVTLYYSGKRQNLELQISYKQAELQVLRNQLAESVSLFDFSRLCTITLYMEDFSKYNDVLKSLEEYHNLLATRVNYWGVMYANQNHTVAQQRFQEQYEKCIQQFVQNMTTLERRISSLRDAVSNHLTSENIANIFEERDIAHIIDLITEITNQKEVAKKETNHLFHLAQEWIQEAENEINQLTNQL